MPGMFADELYCSRSERSSLEVALEQVSRPLSVAVGLEMDEAALSEAGRLDVGRPCSMNGTPSDTKEKLSHNLTWVNHIPLFEEGSLCYCNLKGCCC